MKKMLMVSALLGLCTSVSADSNVCHFSTDYNVNIESDRVIFSKTGGDRFEFTADKLLINDKKVRLNSTQAKASRGLHQSAREMVPKIADIAIDGAELGIKATTLVMTSLFGNDQQVHKDLIAPIEKLSDKIKANISDTTFNVEALETSIDDAFDHELEQLMETAITQYSGKMVSSVLASVFSGDSEELEDLEFRLENMEREIETYVEANAGDIEARAEELCVDMVAVDAFDDELVSVDGYPREGLIYKNKDKGVKFGGFNLDID